MGIKRFCLSVLMVLGMVATARAHELWISPQEYAVSPGAAIAADIRVGQAFKGSAYPFIPDDYVRFEIAIGDAVVPVVGRMGDMPALKMPVPGEGLAVIVVHTTPGILLYDKPEMFSAFVAHKDLEGVLEAHKTRSLPDVGFRESYARFGKSLVAVGNGVGADRVFGLETEIVALANPYTSDLSGGLPVQVLYQGKPRPDVQVEIFAKTPDGKVEVTTLRTDTSGRAVIPVKRGTEYLIDSVVMRPAEGGGAGDNAPVWESLWASLTFKTPRK